MRSFGIRRSRSLAVVVNVRARVPLRWAVRPSARCHGPAPITEVASASINSWYRCSVAVRIRSLTSVPFNASNSSSKADWSIAIVRCVLP